MKTTKSFVYFKFYHLGRYDNMADVFSIITTLQALEKAYIKDVVEPAQYVLFLVTNQLISISSRYTRQCESLLAKYAAAFGQIRGEFPHIEDFAHKYKVM